MTKTISAADYRRQFVKPALSEDTAFEKALETARKKNSTVVGSQSKSGKNVMPSPTEHEIQSAILERLSLLSSGFFWRENSGQFMVGDGNNKRFFRAGISGIADVMGVFQGSPVAIEVKRPGKKQSLDQRAFQQRFENCGGIYIVATDPTQVVNQIMAAIAVAKGK